MEERLFILFKLTQYFSAPSDFNLKWFADETSMLL